VETLKIDIWNEFVVLKKLPHNYKNNEEEIISLK